MPTNVYFDTGTTSEQRLYEDLIVEQLKIYGQDVYYLPRKIANKDTIFGEDPASSFDDSYIIEMYVDNTDGYMGEQEIIKKFGLELRDDITFTVSKSRWETLVGNNSDLVAERPQEGDLVYFPTTKAFFEIQFVEHEQPFYQQSALPVYKLSCTKWEYSSERVDTGISQIDSLEDSLSTDTMNFQFTLENEVGSFLLESDTGEISYLINEDFTMATQQPTDQGKTFETQAGTTTSSTADDILDFSERNPFGEVDEY
mgnify:CR=1 FL=1|jgi:hypothetical protein|tara:strand:- start:69 stop:836 length:768 start_codon:yes stop_codon:yes gene_type:complete